MFIYGDARQPLAETALVIEEIVQQQIIEMVSCTTSFPYMYNLLTIYLGM
jgi:transcription initiation factor IID TFIID-18 subunit